MLGLVGEDPPAVEGADRDGARRASRTAGMAWRRRKQLDGRHGKRWAGRPPWNPAGSCSCCRGAPRITRTPSVLVGRPAAYGLRRPYAGSSWEKNEREKT